MEKLQKGITENGIDYIQASDTSTKSEKSVK